MRKIAVLAADNFECSLDFIHKITQSIQNLLYKARTVEYPCYRTDIEKSMMIAFYIDGDLDALPGDTY